MNEIPNDTQWLPRLAEEEPSHGLEAVRAHIAADLVARHGRFRARGFLAKSLPGIAALVAAMGFALSRASSREWLDLPSALMALLGALLAGAGAGLAPSRPGWSERLSLVAIMVAAAALALEGARGGSGSFMASSALACGLIIVVGAAAPTLALALGVVRSGLAARPLHALATASAGMLAAGAVQWRNCSHDDQWHIAVAHLGIPLVMSLAAAALVARVTRPSPLPS